MKKFFLKRTAAVVVSAIIALGNAGPYPVYGEEKTGSPENKASVQQQKKDTSVSGMIKRVEAASVMDRSIRVENINAGDGNITRTITFSVPRRSSGGYSDSVSWSVGKLRSTCGGRKRSGGEQVSSHSSGNTLTVELSHLLDFEDYSLDVYYVQTYYWDETHSYQKQVGDNEYITEYYTVKKSATVSGSKNSSFTTAKDRYIRNAADLNEKVHKYSSVSLACDIDMGGLQCVADGAQRGSWKSEGISSVTIDGNGRTVRRSGTGACFIAANGTTLNLSDVHVNAFSGSIVETATDGGEYITRNASGGAGGVGILVGFDPAFDEGHDSSSGKLNLSNSEVYGGRSAVVFRYGSVDISSSTLYGMGDVSSFRISDDLAYYGTGFGLINSSGEMKAEARVRNGSCIYGRFNSVFMLGTPTLAISDSFIRGDCEDAFDFRGSGELSITGCSIVGVKGIDIFHDATYHGIRDAIDRTSGRFDSAIFRKNVLKDRAPSQKTSSADTKGVVRISDTTMNLYTGVFSAIASVNGCAIQNHGHLEIGKGVRIYVRHSGAWDTLPSGERSDAIGIWNSKRIDLPDDIVIDTDDEGINCTRDVSTLRSVMSFYFGMSSDETAQIEKKACLDEKIFDYLDDGLCCSLTVRGGTIRGADTGIMQTFGNLTIMPAVSVLIEGESYGISIGKNGVDNIYGDDAMDVSFKIIGDGKTEVRSSLHGNGITIKKTTHGELESALTVSGTDGRCGRGIVNHGFSQIKNAEINAEECGINNALGGTMYLGDDLDDEGSRVTISGAVCGIDNSGKTVYYRTVDITDSGKAAVLQNGTFYMPAGACVTPDKTGHNVIFLKPGRTVRFFYDESEEDRISNTKGTFFTDEDDREPGRVMVELYSPWDAGGGKDYSDESYTDLSDEEKIKVTDLMSGFDLAFDKVHEHPSALRSALGKYGDEDTNGRTGTLVLSCLLEAVYDDDFPVKNDHISARNPEKTRYYWREPTEFNVASDIFETDRSRIFYDGTDIMAGLKQTGWRDKEADGKYGSDIYSDARITRIYGDDHTFCGMWDTQFELLFDGNGQTNGAENYTESNVSAGYAFPGNSGPERKQKDYFRKSVKKDDMMHPCAYEGWSLSDTAIYRDEGIYREGDRPDTSEFYIDAISEGNVALGDKATVRIYAVWDEYPVITAYDSYFYAKELDDPKKVRTRLLGTEVVSARDKCDGDIPQDKITVYTDPHSDTFDVETMKGLGDRGSVNVYYKASDNNGHTSIVSARVHIMTEDSEDSTDDLPHETAAGNSGTSKDTMSAAPVYVRHIDKDGKKSLISGSVWKEEEYTRALDSALDGSRHIEKWHFTDSDIDASSALLYGDNASIEKWQQQFAGNRVESSADASDDRNKPMIIEKGLSSFKVIFDLKSETDRIDLTLTAADGKSVASRSLARDKGKRMPSCVIIDSLEPGMEYDIAADLYYRDKYVKTLSQTAVTAALEKPDTELLTEDSGKNLDVKIQIRADRNVSQYVVERRKAGKDTTAWEEVATVRNTGDDVLRYNESIDREGIYLYRVESLGSQIGSSELTESYRYSDEMETAFIRQPVIDSLEKGCRSIGVHLTDDTDADYVRVFYQTEGGALMHTDYGEEKKDVVISDERLCDGTEYQVSARAYMTSPGSGRIYQSLESDSDKESTYDLKVPEITRTAQKEIYSAAGNRIEYVTDEHAIRYGISIKKIYHEAGKAELTDIEGSGAYLHEPGETGMYSYVVKAFFNTLDGKEFHLDSDRIEAAYITPQQAVHTEIDDGSSESIALADDKGADGYIVKAVRSDGSTMTIYVPAGKASVSISACGESLTITERRAVLFYNGTEYRGECV